MIEQKWLIAASTIAFVITACKIPDWLGGDRSGADSANIKFPTSQVIFTSTMYPISETNTPFPTMPSAGDVIRTQRANHRIQTATARAARTPTP